jgi:hypothetical protein
VARLVWLAVVVVIALAGAVVAGAVGTARSSGSVASSATAPGAARLPATAMDVVGEHCLEASGALGFTNLVGGYQDLGGRIEGFVVLGTVVDVGTGFPSDGTLDLGKRVATSADRAAVVDRLDACLGGYAFDSELLPSDRADRLRLYQYQRTVYRPCLERHRVDPGAAPKLPAYLGAWSIRELGGLGAQTGRPFAQVLTAVRACPAAPDDLFG